MGESTVTLSIRKCYIERFWENYSKIPEFIIWVSLILNFLIVLI